MRQFIRHSMNVPIELQDASPDASHQAAHAVNISAGGLSFHSTKAIPAGGLVHIRIAIPAIEFETDAKVIWCKQSKHDIEIGVTFLSASDAYQVRMIEQMCYIEDYRMQVRNEEGRDLSIKDAAAEWVQRYAANFPNP